MDYTLSSICDRKAYLILFLVLVLTLLSTGCSGKAGQEGIEAPSFLTGSPSNPDLIQELNQISISERTTLLSMGQDLLFENISLEEGLSQSTVFSIIQDDQGFIWFGTEDGLNRYDGFNITIFKNDPGDSASLASNWIEILLVDREGRLWVGTANGLDRYDHRTGSFIHYRNDPSDPNSIGGNHIKALFEDKHGKLWIGTLDGGISKFDPDSERFSQYRHDLTDPFSISSNRISAIAEDRDGYFWVGTDDSGINLLGRDQDSWIRITNMPDLGSEKSNQFISSIIEDPSGNLWIGMDGGGLSRLTIPPDEKIKLQDGIPLQDINYQFDHFLNNPDDSSSISSDHVTDILVDQDGLLWVGTSTGGLNIYLPGTGGFRHFQHQPHLNNSLENDWILSIFQDREGVYWFGTIGAGINKLGLGWKNFPLFRHIPGDSASLGDDMIRYFLPDREILWVGSMFGGLDRLNTTTGVWQHFRNDPTEPESLSSNFVSTIFKDEAGMIWSGTSEGLNRYNPETGTFVHYLPDPESGPGTPQNNIRAIYEKPAGLYWIGTKGGLYQFDPLSDQWTRINYSDSEDSHNLSDAWILTIMEDQNQSLWITTWGAGLFKIDPDTLLISHYHHDPADPDDLGIDTILSSYQDQSGYYWFGTTAGLYKLDGDTDKFTSYREADGIPNETVYCVLGDSEGHIWISTNLGLSKFDPESETFYNYTVEDGLQSNEFNGNACQYGNHGQMLFGGINGFNLFSPERIKMNSYLPPIVITSVTVEDAVIFPIPENNLKPGIKMKWPESSFEFEYAALSFNQPNQNQYAFYLEGFDDGWNIVGSRRYGKYTNLPGGTYTLHVVGSNNDGIWNQEGTTLQITVIPPFWDTTWFLVLVILSFVGVSYGGFKIRVRSLEKRSRDLEGMVKDRTEKLMEAQIALKETDLERAVVEERNRLARELHDSVTQSLYSLTLFTEAARHLAEDSDIDKLEGYLGQIGSLGLQALKEMRLLVFELRLHALEEDGLVEALEKRLAAVEGRTGVDTRVITENLEKPAPFIETQLFHIAQEALNNALKHAEASAVEVKFRQDGMLIEMEIKDDGVGFDPGSLGDSPGMGLKNIQERVKRMGGQFEISTSSGEGTRLKVSIRTDGPLV